MPYYYLLFDVYLRYKRSDIRLNGALLLFIVCWLFKVQEERDRRMKDASMLETHIMQAQARAMTADERELNRVSSRTSSFPDLGLPPCK